MSIEDPPTSPRLSFSHDLVQPANPSPPNKPINHPVSDFDFNVSTELGSTHADELFSDGKIIPLLHKNANPDPNPLAEPVNSGGKDRSAVKKSLWKFGRSSSLNCAGGGMMKIKFSRSSSAGSDPNPNPKQLRAKSTKKSCYFDSGRINPVPLYTKEKGLIGILMCNCLGGGGGAKMGMEYY